AVSGDVHAEQQEQTAERRREQRKRVARRLGLEPAGAAARPAHEHRRSDRRCEEDELLAERVEAAVVEDDRADDIRRVALVNGDDRQAEEPGHRRLRDRLARQYGAGAAERDNSERHRLQPGQRFYSRLIARPVSAASSGPSTSMIPAISSALIAGWVNDSSTS